MIGLPLICLAHFEARRTWSRHCPHDHHDHRRHRRRHHHHHHHHDQITLDMTVLMSCPLWSQADIKPLLSSQSLHHHQPHDHCHHHLHWNHYLWYDSLDVLSTLKPGGHEAIDGVWVTSQWSVCLKTVIIIINMIISIIIIITIIIIIMTIIIVIISKEVSISPLFIFLLPAVIWKLKVFLFVLSRSSLHQFFFLLQQTSFQNIYL